MRFTSFGAAATAALLFVSQSSAVPVISFNESTGSSTLGNISQCVGMPFDVKSPLTVTGLSWFDEGHNGLAQSHQVGIWNYDGDLLASATIPAGTSATLEGQWRVVPIEPVTLPQAQLYVVGGMSAAGDPERVAYNVTLTSIDSRIFPHPAAYADWSLGFSPPNRVLGGVNRGYFGPSFTVAPVPEPTALAVAATGAAGVLIRRPRRSRT